jgi:hypothetical protein
MRREYSVPFALSASALALRRFPVAFLGGHASDIGSGCHPADEYRPLFTSAFAYLEVAGRKGTALPALGAALVARWQASSGRSPLNPIRARTDGRNQFGICPPGDFGGSIGKKLISGLENICSKTQTFEWLQTQSGVFHCLPDVFSSR